MLTMIFARKDASIPTISFHDRISPVATDVVMCPNGAFAVFDDEEGEPGFGVTNVIASRWEAARVGNHHPLFGENGSSL